MDKNTVLVVMPIYNAEATLANAIESILNQSYKKIKLVLVDDFSTDGSLEIARKYAERDHRVAVVSNKKNYGAYYSRNMGLYKYRDHPWGYFTTHDADDISYPDRISLMVEQFKNPKVVAVQDTFERKYLTNKRSISVSITLAHAMFPKFIFDELGYFESKRFGADWEHWARVSLYARVHGFTTRPIKQVQGESFVSKSNLTVQVPLNSQERSNYIQLSRKRHQEAVKNKNGLYVTFNTKMTPPPPIKPNSQISSAYQEGSKKTVVNIKPKSELKVTVVLLTWQRIGELKKTLRMLANQTYKNFNIRISNGNLKYKEVVDKHAKMFSEDLDMFVSHDGNEMAAFRRFTVGRELAESGTDIVLFIDDDISFEKDYVENCLRYYEPRSYKSGFAWSFQNNGQNYYDYRTRIYDFKSKIHYCGTGISMVDARIFLDKRLIDKAPPEAYLIEDLWLSYFAQHVLKWKLGYIEMKNVAIGGTDNAALYKQILNDKKSKGLPDKADFLRMLVSRPYNWKL
jgi:glycosyltransferase involved in cell wall biosynthesis